MSQSDTIKLSHPGTAGEVVIPASLGPIRLVRQIGRGGMGVVWLGQDQMLGRRVAVKFLLGAIAAPDDPSFSHFLEGARAAAAVTQRGLGAVYTAGLVDRVPYLVMEYIDGPTLAAVLEQGGPLEPAAAVAAIDEACAAAAALHEAGIIHRDIKPSNILLEGTGRLVLTDFGLACQRPYGEPGTARAGIGGTPAYMAPEMFDGALSARSDVYALGVTMFELLAGSPPFLGSIEHIRRCHREEPLRVELLHARAVPATLVEIIERATRKPPMQRYRTAHHMLDAIRHAQADPHARAQGAAGLRRRVADLQGEPPPAPAPAPTPRESYYERLSQRAAEKRDQAPPAPAPPAPLRCATLHLDLECLTCGYNLRGLESQAACPECATPVAASVSPTRLAFADPRWLRRVALGHALLVAGLAVLAMMMPVGIAAVFISPVFIRYGTFPVVLASLILWIAGSWVATSPQPGANAPMTRALARWLPLAGAALILLANLSSRSGAVPDILVAGACAGQAAFVVGAGALLLTLYRLAERAPDRRVLRRSRLALVGIGFWSAATLWSLLTVAVPMLRGVPSESPASRWQNAAAFGCTLVTVAALMYLLVALDAGRRMLKRQVTRAVPYPTAFGEPAPVGSATRRRAPINPVAASGAVFVALVVPGFFVGEYVILWCYQLGDALGLLVTPRGALDQTVWIKGHAFKGVLPSLPTAAATALAVLAAYAAPALIALAVYHRLAWRARWPDGATHCGWCGYVLCGLVEPRCPECGRRI